MVAGDWASIALPVELDATGTGAAVVEAPLAPVNLQQIEANDLDKVYALLGSSILAMPPGHCPP